MKLIMIFFLVKKDKLDAVLDAKLMSKRELIARQIENDVSNFVYYTE